MYNQTDKTNKKSRKSFLIVICTMVLGWCIPALCKITGIAQVDKFIWKLLFSVALNITTLIVSICFSTGILKDEKKGEKTKVIIYLSIAIIISCCITSLLAFLDKSGPLFFLLVAATMVAILIIYVLKFKRTVKEIKHKLSFFARRKAKREKKLANISRQNLPIVLPKTLVQLWEENIDKTGSIFVVNSRNENIEWVEITKKPYKSVVVFANVKLVNQVNAKFDEVKDSDKKIWFLYANNSSSVEKVKTC